jgi:acetyl esterase/lipase
MLNTFAPKSGFSSATNIVFDKASGLKLDVYTPDNARKAPVVVFFYGGRWQADQTKPKEDYLFVGQALTSQGFVTVIPDYRTYPPALYPTFVQDCAKAVAWVHANIGTYGGNPDAIVIMGHEAGAYNAAMLALNPRFQQAAGGSRGWLKGMIGLAGPYDFLPIVDPTLRAIFGSPDQYNSTQPVMWVDGSNPPILLIHGEVDTEVPVQNTRSLAQHIQNAGGPVETVIYPDLDNQWVLNSLSSTWRTRADVLPNITEFVRRVTGTPAPAGAPPQ